MSGTIIGTIPAGSPLANALNANPSGTVVVDHGNITTTYGPEFVSNALNQNNQLPTSLATPPYIGNGNNPFSQISAFSSAGGSSQGISTQPNQAFPTQMSSSDFRVRISPLNPSFYGASASAGTNSPSAAPNLLSPLIATGGVMFPYSPTISFEQSVDYSQTDMIQTNMTYEVYRKTPSVTITLAGKFTVQNNFEGIYALAAVHFFRVASKMYFGTAAGVNAGLPPPILQLSGYGTYMFNKLNCVLKSHSFSYDEQIDTVSVNVAGGTARLPSMFTLSVTLTVQQTPQAMKSQFSLDDFRTGKLMQSGGWI